MRLVQIDVVGLQALERIFHRRASTNYILGRMGHEGSAVGDHRCHFRIRAPVLGSEREKEKPRQPGLVDRAKSCGWGVLAEDPGHEIVFGAVTDDVAISDQAWLSTFG
jgi:hypothetical protein